MKKLLPTLLGLYLASPSAYAIYYATLPEGVRAFAYHYTATNGITSSYNDQKQNDPHFIQQNFDAKTLEGVNKATNSLFNELKKSSPEAYNKFSFGSYEARAKANINVQTTAFGYGITKKYTSYVTFPYYRAKVDLDIDRTQESKHSEVSNTLGASNDYGAGNQLTLLWEEVAKNLPDASPGVIQSVIVNHYQYEPLGSWSGEGPGDLEWMNMYRLTDWKDAGLMICGGLVLPTGREDNPDMIQDVAFGDGQLDAFTEFGGGVSFFKGQYQVDSYTRLTYQAPSQKTKRAYTSSDFPLTNEKAEFEEKLGNKVLVGFINTYVPTHWSALSVEYQFNYKEADRYSSSNSLANSALAANTETHSQALKFMVELSSVDFYFKKKFPLPMKVYLSMQDTIAGKNTPDVTRYDFELRFFF
jgi:hypothetical protein